LPAVCATSAVPISLSASNPTAPNNAPRAMLRHVARVPDRLENSTRKISVLKPIATPTDSSRSAAPAPGT